jgi:hypothetical protein
MGLERRPPSIFSFFAPRPSPRFHFQAARDI